MEVTLLDPVQVEVPAEYGPDASAGVSYDGLVSMGVMDAHGTPVNIAVTYSDMTDDFGVPELQSLILKLMAFIYAATA